MIDILNKANERIKFNVEKHLYSIGNKDLISVSKFISLFKNPFDPDGEILKRCASKKGIPHEELKAEWEKTKQDACNFGTGLHTEIEHYIKNKEVRNTKYKQILSEFSKLKFGGQLYSEVIIFDEEFGLAGTCDLVEYYPKTNSLYLHDWKSNKKLDKYSFWKNKMLPPIEYLDDCNFNLYQLQLSLYAYMLDNQGFWVDDLSIFHINKKTETIKKHEVDYKRKEVVLMLEYYKQHGNSRPVENLDDDFDF
ncbi:MAG: PD-(D/E)XK nuclease family protein [Nanoarchaeota archaeon]